jgi:hypothetical protein
MTLLCMFRVRQRSRQLAVQLLSPAGPRFRRAAVLGTAPLTGDWRVAAELDHPSFLTKFSSKE